MTFLKPTFVCLFALLVGVAVAYSQGSGSSRSDPSRPTRPPTPEEFYQSFWSFLVKKDAAYNTWKELTREAAVEGVENPHGPVLKTYVNKTAAADLVNLPVGSVLVREDYDDQRKRQSISVMYRVKDYDKEHGHWYYLRYSETGAVLKGRDNKPLAGKVASCIDCHAKAGNKDYVFSNVPPPPSKPDSADKPADAKE